MSRKFVVLTSAKTALVLSTLVAIGTVSLGQTNPRSVPQPPSVELQKFEPFLGKYEVSGDYANLPWAGTLELKKVIKGWYIEQIIQITSPGIDREFWVLATWDKNAQKYRLWGFQTLPSQVEGDVRFEDDEMITEFTYPGPDGQKATSTNRYKFTGKDELLVTSYRQIGNGSVEKIGTLIGKRITAPDTALSSAHNVTGTVTVPNRETSMAKESSGSEAELRTVMAELRKASLEGDADTVANSMTDDYVQTDINGYRQDKTTWLNEYFRPLADLIKAGKFHWDEYERTNLQFRLYGDCAIVTGELHAKATGAKPGPHTWVPDPNASFSGTLHFTHVYIKQNGKWMLAALHNQMPLPPANNGK